MRFCFGWSWCFVSWIHSSYGAQFKFGHCVGLETVYSLAELMSVGRSKPARNIPRVRRTCQGFLQDLLVAHHLQPQSGGNRSTHSYSL